MRIEFVDKVGKRKIIERTYSVECHVCGASLKCPSHQDPWSWDTPGGAADNFRKEHLKHAPPYGNVHLVGSMFTERELA